MKPNIKYTSAISVALLLSFFIPWISWRFLKFSGYDLPPVINSIYTTGRLTIDGIPIISMAYLLYLIPFLCVLSIIRDLTGLRLVPVTSEFIAGLVLGGVFYYYIDNVGNNFLYSLSIGYYLTIISSVLGLVFSVIQRNLKVQSY
ncbi:hypothetical protein [Chitinophaga silvisoli]|nr:hypothetical protein [Chitinophaga silvisoli]